MIINNVEVNVLRGADEVPLKEYGLDCKTFIEAKDGFEYSLRIRNNNPYRVLVVASVDGLSVLDGKAASKDGNGYVLNAYDKLNIKGYRATNEEVGAFKFVKKPQSYAASKGDPSNVGVISVAVFKEKQYWQYNNYILQQKKNDCDEYFWNDSTIKPIISGTTYTCDIKAGNIEYKSDNVLRGMSRESSQSTYSCNINSSVNAQAFNCAQATPQPQSVETFAAGSTWGKKIQDKVVEVSFEKESNCPCAEFNVYYDFRAGLEKLGIKFTKETQVNFPNGFPGKYAEPPSGWKS